MATKIDVQIDKSLNVFILHLEEINVEKPYILYLKDKWDEFQPIGHFEKMKEVTDKLKEIESSDEVCTCNLYEYNDVCPYQEEIHGIQEICNCCPHCRHECALDI